jgi:DNA polymerase
MLIGEVPGDYEDLTGKPFVGPAGKLLDRCMAEAGLDRKRTYITNAVKHFKWTQAGRRRLHKRPNAGEIQACRPWLDAELAIVKPQVVVCLGATAAQAVIDKNFKVTRSRGQFVQSPIAPYVMATVHPSSLLRGDPETREHEIERFITDLRKVAPNALKRSQA